MKHSLSKRPKVFPHSHVCPLCDDIRGKRATWDCTDNTCLSERNGWINTVCDFCCYVSILATVVNFRVLRIAQFDGRDFILERRKKYAETDTLQEATFCGSFSR